MSGEHDWHPPVLHDLGIGQPGAAPPVRPAPPWAADEPDAAPPRQLPAEEPTRPLPSQAAPPAALTPDAFTRTPVHGDAAMRRAGRRVRQALGVNAAQELRATAAHAEQLRQTVPSVRRIAVLSLRGGAGKTTVALLLATAFAYHRSDRVLAVDADPTLGSLALRAGVWSPRSVADIGRSAPSFRSFSEVEPFLGRTGSGLRLLTGPFESDGSDALDLAAYQAAATGVARFFGVLVTDCGVGTGTMLNRGILVDANALALVTPATVDGVVSAQHTLTWLRSTPVAALIPRTIVVLSTHSPHLEGVDLDRGAKVLAAHGVSVVRLPYDRHLASGAKVQAHLLGERTRLVAMQVAAELLTSALSDQQ